MKNFENFRKIFLFFSDGIFFGIFGIFAFFQKIPLQKNQGFFEICKIEILHTEGRDADGAGDTVAIEGGAAPGGGTEVEHQVRSEPIVYSVVDVDRDKKTGSIFKDPKAREKDLTEQEQICRDVWNIDNKIVVFKSPKIVCFQKNENPIEIRALAKLSWQKIPICWTA